MSVIDYGRERPSRPRFEIKGKENSSSSILLEYRQSYHEDATDLLEAIHATHDDARQPETIAERPILPL